MTIFPPTGAPIILSSTDTSQIQRTSAGLYRFSIDTTAAAGLWRYEVDATGADAVIKQRKIRVVPRYA